MPMPVYAEEVTRADCRKKNFTGLRCDRILLNMEIWREGVLVHECTKEEMLLNPDSFKRAYANAFGLYEDQVVLTDIIPQGRN